MFLALFFVIAAVVIVTTSLLRVHRGPLLFVADDKENSRKLEEMRAFGARDETALAFTTLIDEDGAGSWPPRTNHDTWPLALRPYKDIYLELVPLLPAAKPSIDDEVNNRRRQKYRSLMRKLLAERISIQKVEAVLRVAEVGNWDLFPRDAYNGFYSCVAVLRHAYRWATIPVVKVAQLEKVVDFPPELDTPWPYLQRKFGVTAESGNNTANVLHNFDERGERVYKINVGMTEPIVRSEEIFFRIFYDLEVRGLPIYHAMVRAIINFNENDKASCLKQLQTISLHQRNLLQSFHENLRDSRVSRSVWMSYVQSFQGWGVGRMVDGEFIKYDGLSGNHVLIFQAIDAFLGLDRYLTDENMDRYIPINQRNLCLAFKKHCFRGRLGDGPEDAMIRIATAKITSQMRAFRAAHRARVMSYLEQPAPERLTMTAGKSLLQGSSPSSDLKEVLKPLDIMLLERLQQTV